MRHRHLLVALLGALALAGCSIDVNEGKGQVNIKKFVETLKKVGYRGSLCIEREVGDQKQRIADIQHGIKYLQGCV